MAEKEITFKLPLDIIEKSPGFGLDIGQSIAKIAYRSKEPMTHNDRKAGFGTVKLVNLPKTSIDDVIKVVVDNCQYTQDGTVEVRAAGWEPNECKDKLEYALKVKICPYSEFMCLTKAVALLCRILPPDELYLPLSPAAMDEGVSRASGRIGNFHALGDAMVGAGTPHEATPLADSVQFPLLLVMAGSGFVLFKVYADGAFELLDIGALGGRAYLGITSTLANTKNVDEINRMIKESNGRTCDVWMGDIASPEKVDDTISMVPKTEVFFPFGKGWSDPADSLTAGDKVFSITRIAALVLAQHTFMTAKAFALKHIIFSGNFLSMEKVQHIMTAELSMKNELLRIQGMGEGVNFKFLKHGGSYGALGCFMYNSFSVK